MVANVSLDVRCSGKGMDWNGCAHVVVEDRVRVAVLVEEPLCVRHAEVFEMEQAVRVVFADELHEPESACPFALVQATGD